MPPLLERRKMTKSMYQALKRHILREREKKKQEQEADNALERQRREAERRKQKQQEDTATLEQTKIELGKLETQLEAHKKEKSKLFAQLKRVLENENTKKENEKKHETQHYPVQTGGNSVQFLSGTGHMGRPVMFKPSHHGQPAHPNGSAPSQLKRTRSPSPNPGSVPPGVSYPFAPQDFTTKMYSKPPTSSGQPVYHQHPVSQSGGIYGATPAGASKYAHPSQSAFSSFPNPGNPQGSKHDFQGQPPFTMQQRLPHSLAALSPHEKHRLPGDEKLNRSLPSSHPQQRLQHPPQKGSIMTGFPVHSSQNQLSVINTHPHNITGRHPYQQHEGGARYY